MPPSDDVFPPPGDAVEVCCIECGWTYMSDLMVPIQIGQETHWMCPVPECGALGFMFDIFPTDPQVAAEHGCNMVELDEDDGELDFEPIPSDSSLADAFDPPQEWMPQSDAEPGPDAASPCDDEAERYFTRDDYLRARAEGVYDRAAIEIRERWKQFPPTSRSAGDPKDLPPGFADDDVPF